MPRTLVMIRHTEPIPQSASSVPPADSVFPKDFRRSRGCCVLERIFDIRPTSINVVDVRVHACRRRDPRGRASTLGASGLLDRVSSNCSPAFNTVDGSLRACVITLGYAKDANRNGRGMSSAVSASGSSSHDL
jgi:hypothetical protein